MGFKLTFWGVRGSIACPGPKHLVYGGNTSCVEAVMGGEHVILDGGTGIRNAGCALLRQGVRSGTIMFSHAHWDHINGLPFFAPAFEPNHTFRIMAGNLGAYGGIGKLFSAQMEAPNLPVRIDTAQAQLDFEDFHAGDRFTIGGERAVEVRTAPLNHPNGATGYRLQHRGRSVCYVTDTEHRPGQLDENILALIEGADLLIYDCTYTDEEFQSHVGWGHSTWEEGVRLARAGRVRRLAIFHHDPEHEDPFMDRLALTARREWSGAFIAREGMQIDIERMAREAAKPRLVVVPDLPRTTLRQRNDGGAGVAAAQANPETTDADTVGKPGPHLRLLRKLTR